MRYTRRGRCNRCGRYAEVTPGGECPWTGSQWFFCQACRRGSPWVLAVVVVVVAAVGLALAFRWEALEGFPW